MNIKFLGQDCPLSPKWIEGVSPIIVNIDQFTTELYCNKVGTEVIEAIYESNHGYVMLQPIYKFLCIGYNLFYYSDYHGMLIYIHKGDVTSFWRVSSEDVEIDGDTIRIGGDVGRTISVDYNKVDIYDEIVCYGYKHKLYISDGLMYYKYINEEPMLMLGALCDGTKPVHYYGSMIAIEDTNGLYNLYAGYGIGSLSPLGFNYTRLKTNGNYTGHIYIKPEGSVAYLTIEDKLVPVSIDLEYKEGDDGVIRSMSGIMYHDGDVYDMIYNKKNKSLTIEIR